MLLGYNAMKRTLPVGPRTIGYKHKSCITQSRTQEENLRINREFADNLRKEVSQDLGIPACASVGYPPPDREILADTGSGEHLVGSRDMTLDEKKLIYKGDPIHLATANGVITADKRFDIPFAGITDGLAAAVVLDKTPTVASIGRLCMTDDFEFVWPNRSTPYLRDIVTGQRCETTLQHFVPHFSRSSEDHCNTIKAAVGKKKDEPETDLLAQLPGGKVEGTLIDAPPGLEVVPPPPCPSQYERSKKEATSLRHRITHFLKNPHCKICLLYTSPSPRD